MNPPLLPSLFLDILNQMQLTQIKLIIIDALIYIEEKSPRKGIASIWIS